MTFVHTSTNQSRHGVVLSASFSAWLPRARDHRTGSRGSRPSAGCLDPVELLQRRAEVRDRAHHLPHAERRRDPVAVAARRRRSSSPPRPASSSRSMTASSSTLRSASPSSSFAMFGDGPVRSPVRPAAARGAGRRPGCPRSPARAAATRPRPDHRRAGRARRPAAARRRPSSGGCSRSRSRARGLPFGFPGDPTPARPEPHDRGLTPVFDDDLDVVLLSLERFAPAVERDAPRYQSLQP